MSDFCGLLEKETSRLRRYARASTGDRPRADDLVQDTLVRAITKQNCWQPGTDLRAWLFTIMHNQNVNVVRRSVRGHFRHGRRGEPKPSWREATRREYSKCAISIALWHGFDRGSGAKAIGHPAQKRRRAVPEIERVSEFRSSAGVMA